MPVNEIAEKLRNSNIWNPDLCLELCKAAGLEEEYRESDGETFESVVNHAADILGVDIY